MNHSAITDSPLLYDEKICIPLFCKNDFIDLLQDSLLLSTHILFGLQFDSSKISWNAVVIVIRFLSFKGIIHAYLL